MPPLVSVAHLDLGQTLPLDNVRFRILIGQELTAVVLLIHMGAKIRAYTFSPARQFSYCMGKIKQSLNAEGILSDAVNSARKSPSDVSMGAGVCTRIANCPR